MGRGVTDLQLGLFPELELHPTPAQTKAGVMRVDQCAHCGTLVAMPSTVSTTKMGACPACSSDAGWWRQDFPVGPFRRRPA